MESLERRVPPSCSEGFAMPARVGFPVKVSKDFQSHSAFPKLDIRQRGCLLERVTPCDGPTPEPTLSRCLAWSCNNSMNLALADSQKFQGGTP